MARDSATTGAANSSTRARTATDAQGQHHHQERQTIDGADNSGADELHLAKARALLNAVAGYGRRGRLQSSPAVLATSEGGAKPTNVISSSSADELRQVATTIVVGADLSDAELVDTSDDGSSDGVDAFDSDGVPAHVSGPVDSPWDESIVLALALLQQAQEATEHDASGGVTQLSKDALDHILEGFVEALKRGTPSSSSSSSIPTSTDGSRSSREVEHQMERLFVSHANVFDEKVQNFIIQNFIQETDYAKEFRSAIRRTSLVKRCLKAMYPMEKSLDTKQQPHATAQKMKAAAMAARANGDALETLDACPEVTNPETIRDVKQLLAGISDWGFDLFSLSEAVPGQTLVLVGNELLDRYDLSTHFHTTKFKQIEFLRQIQAKYPPNPYHNAEHAADVAQTLHHFLRVGRVGETVNPRSQCAAIIAAIIHDVGHTSYSNNFHIAANDDLAVQYVYRSPLEHMHCAVAFQQMKAPRSNILQGLSRIEQMEVRTLITDMVLATDNSVHATYLAKLDTLVCNSAQNEDGFSPTTWTLSAHPDDERLVLQMALHAADVSNPAKSLEQCRLWAERILLEFYQQGDKERELELPVSIGYDRENPIPLEKMQAGFILGIVRPLFTVFCRLPHTELSHCLTQLDQNLAAWQRDISQTLVQ